MNSANNSQIRVLPFWRRPGVQTWAVFSGALLLSLSFTLASYAGYQPGFPLDDSWIHQTYARNLAVTGEWQFNPGEISGGSTSPLWTALLAFGHLLGFKSPFIWTIVVSTVCFAGLVFCAVRTLLVIINGRPGIALLGGLLVALEWHLLWASASGMETILYCVLITAIFLLLLRGECWVWVSVITGLLVWVRPDGLTILGPVVLIFVAKIFKTRQVGRELFYLVIPAAILLGGWAWFNHSITGMIFPNTFYAKQTEYAVLLTQPILDRILPIFSVPLAGFGAFLVPGFIFSLIQALKKRDLWRIAATLWFFGFGLLYAVRLPVTYQHGRYLIPMTPIFLILGFVGSVELGTRISMLRPGWGQLGRLLVSVGVGVSLMFAYVGSKTLTEDIKVIDKLMVQPALWIKANTPADALIAAHDIGALGFYAERNIFDLAGLIQPEIVPIVRDENALRDLIVKNEADYLVVFSDWYETLANEGQLTASFDHDTGTIRAQVQIRKLK